MNEETNVALQQELERILSVLELTPELAARLRDYPSGFEPGLKNEHNDTMVLLRDDGVAQLSSGKSVQILADGPGGQATVSAPATVLSGNNLHLHTPQYGLWFGYQRFNPWWFSAPLNPTDVGKGYAVTTTGGNDVTVSGTPDVLSWKWQKAPLVQTGPDSRYRLADIVCGVPQEGQRTENFSLLFEAQPLFGPNEMYLIYTEHLKSVAETLGHV